MEFKNIIFTVDQGVATITLNTPNNLNSLSGPMYDDITAALYICDNQSDIRAVVINANGRAFCGGGDIAEMVEGLRVGDLGFDVLAPKANHISKMIKQLSKPVIASVHGAVAGAAFNIAIACDLCIAAEDAKFIQAFVNIGLIPDAGGMFLLTRAIGVNKAMELAMLGRVVKADEAVQLGLVYKKCAKEDLGKETMELARKLANGPGRAYAELKKLVYESQYQDFEKYMSLESATQVKLGTTADFKEGITSFLEKRPAIFEGK